MSRPENSKQRLNCRGGTPWPPQVAGAGLTGDDVNFVNAKGPRGDETVATMGLTDDNETVATMGRPRRDAPTDPAGAGWSLGGTGLRYVPVKRSGNQSDSPEEVECIVELVRELLRGETTWTNKEGEILPLQLKDILVVAPYNAQVLALKEALPGAKVGTVDKFQGQQAPVVFYSMTTSTAEDAPRGMEFLYSLNRLNVATSREQCVTILVASPALFQVQCKTPRQIELANAFCHYLEMARSL
ncbi:hypothetical protein BH18ACI4_BH18ACI4_24850 [soil metagenome]